MVDPGTGIAIAQIAFFAACKAVDAFGTALHYFDDAEALTVALEIERLRLQAWGANSGLADGILAPHLSLASEVLLRELQVISRMFEDADKVRERYGVKIEGEESTSKAVSSFVTRMRKSLRSSGVKLYGGTPLAIDVEGSEDSETARKNSGISRSMSSRVRWAIRDKDQLKKLVTGLRDEIDLLNKLLTETQRRRFVNDYERIHVVVVGSAVDDKSLAMIREAVDIDRDGDTLAKIDRKSLAANENRPSGANVSQIAMKSLRLAQHDIPSDFATQNRFLAARKDDPVMLCLFERKSFEPDLDHNSKMMLWSRVQRLISLLALPQSPGFKVPQAVGYIHDPEHYCWWLVFQFPQNSRQAPGDFSKPLSLYTLLQPEYKPRPPLEKRFRLASDISSTFHQLYSSSWMHKSIRSDNIVFPCQNSESPSAGQLASPIVCGFEYSRLETEAQTIDRSKSNSDPAVAMYRHPDYQGEAAQGYKVQYDIYSLGLVLLEIGIWAPLTSLFDSKRGKTSSSRPSLSIDVKPFHSPEAKILRERVRSTIDKDLPFRMGSTYAALTRWCVDYSEQPSETMDEPPNHALEFYNRVVEPLSSLGLGHSEAGG
ncbi:uncharacterized protein NECHADRAFT_101905 [Fusarium vanettenii 77-13-4]|uniref:Protein kinase domain-containing protein n=1 Tax=Fusarium vanettenii (strain ATCC MYA-4622 / CBS 123669 / FGSC 9596 / NRRL 45880 / 77-13-4) TaxID=660122 RepID=C7Z1T3_FUSV7|nr:uncharacterized protein NECHADRAFT_101905 [Fusarium vanettenii 77-13-4]EEU42056.1 hypothetical protein NECHADRAFT_101905 [Fusarium vanettenii 77-13-4]